jgi:hypothetical protein
MSFGNPTAERAALELTYEGLCTVTEFVSSKDPNTKVTSQQTTVVLADQPCALSQTSQPAARETVTDNWLDYDAKLFISPDVAINAGSVIRVIQNGMDNVYERSGDPFIYATHQEIMLKRVGRA